MKPKRELKLWVKIALLSLEGIVMLSLLFLVAQNLKEEQDVITIQINEPETKCEVIYE